MLHWKQKIQTLFSSNEFQVYILSQQLTNGTLNCFFLFDISCSDNIKNSIWDKLVFKTVQQMLGGNLKLLISGSNQISDMVLNFMRNSLRCTVLQSYEITECSSFVTLTKYNDQSQRKCYSFFLNTKQ